MTHRESSDFLLDTRRRGCYNIYMSDGHWHYETRDGVDWRWRRDYEHPRADGDAYVWQYRSDTGRWRYSHPDGDFVATIGNAQGGWRESKKFKDKEGNWVTRTVWGSGKVGW